MNEKIAIKQKNNTQKKMRRVFRTPFFLFRTSQSVYQRVQGLDP